MTRFLLLVSCVLTAGNLQAALEPLTPLSFDQVTIADRFWGPRMDIQKKVLVPIAFQRTEPALEDLLRTGLVLQGKTDKLPGKSLFVTSDLYKVMEGAAYLLKRARDPELEKKIDSIIDIIGKAQTADGYIYPKISGHPEEKEKPYSKVLLSHELYNMGHMYEAAVAYYQATGKKKLLDIAVKNAEHINRVFFEGDPRYNNGKPVNQASGHEEIELALIKLYRVTDNPLFLEMSKRFLDIRGVAFKPEGTGYSSPEYSQQHLPVREQKEAVGHAVRAAYLYCAMTDVCSMTNDPSLMPALEAVWNNIVNTRMHITGGLGAVHGIEGFGPEYELPNKSAYNETCAAVGNVLFNYRMFLLRHEARFIDVAEVSLYNNVLAGVSLSGDRFFYVNPLASDGNRDRSSWFGTACCPTNLARLIPQVTGFMYAYRKNDIYCAFYGGSSATLPLLSGKVHVEQTTEYPFDSNIRFKISPSRPGQEFTLNLRIPTWTGNQFVPGDLYKYEGKPSSLPVRIRINGSPVAPAGIRNGFAAITRSWQPGDTVVLELPMPVRFNKAHEKVRDDTGRVAVTRGPLVYCAEQADNSADVHRVFLSQEQAPEVWNMQEPPLSGIPAITSVVGRCIDPHGGTEPVSLDLIPYFAWSNRGPGRMDIWLPDNEQTARGQIHVLPPLIRNLSASYTNQGENILSVVGKAYPKNSHDTSVARWTSWPRKGTPQTVRIHMSRPTSLQSLSLYWYDDQKGVRVPEKWSVRYADDQGKWQDFPLYLTDGYSVDKDRANTIHPGKDISVKELEIAITPRPDAAVGILHLEIEQVGH